MVKRKYNTCDLYVVYVQQTTDIKNVSILKSIYYYKDVGCFLAKKCLTGDKYYIISKQKKISTDTHVNNGDMSVYKAVPLIFAFDDLDLPKKITIEEIKYVEKVVNNSLKEQKIQEQQSKQDVQNEK